jgi:glutamate-1-semialdehyde 2,1-aminomutase
MNIKKSIALFEKAKKHIPGGVNSPVRAFKSVGGNPIFMEKGYGCYLYDVDGNKYVDYIASWGPHLFGHNPPFIKGAILKALENGTSFGTPCEAEVKMAELITGLIPQIDMVRMVNSGTEATMSAIRMARGFTGKDKIIKFEGCYHGHGDSFLIKAGSGALTFGVPTSPGITKGTAEDTLNAQYNDINSVQELLEMNKGNIAAIIIEPIAGNMGVISAKTEFLKELRDICDKENIVLIFDEVMTGFRVSQQGATGLLGVKPDMITFGKIIGGGMPVGAFGGKREIMEKVSPSGPIYQAGTLSGNPIAMAAGIAMLKHIKDHPELYTELEQKSLYLEQGFKKNLNMLGFNYAMNRVGSMQCLFFTDSSVETYSEAVKSDTAMYGKYFHEMLNRGIYLAPAQFEAMFISTAHSYDDLDQTIKAHYSSLKSILEK